MEKLSISQSVPVLQMITIFSMHVPHDHYYAIFCRKFVSYVNNFANGAKGRTSGTKSVMNIAILGATGAVGQEFLSLFLRRKFPIGQLRLLASPRSAGSKLAFGEDSIPVEAVGPNSFEGVEIAFFSAGASRSREWLEPAQRAGATVIDNSSAFRMDPGVPLVVPEINWDQVRPDTRLIANPNCTAAILCMALAPLRNLAPLSRVIVSTYQSASGAGAAAMQELTDQTRAVLEGKDPEPKVLPHPYAFNLFSHNTPINPQGQNEEEAKVVEETRKILGQPGLGMNVTCVRVPILRAHSESVTIEFASEAPDLDSVHQALASFPGVRVVDDPLTNTFPMPITASGAEEILVGRIRRDPSHPAAISLFICGDQLLKGAALNAVQIAERLLPVESGR